MSKVTSHVLDTSLGKPAAGIPVQLELNSAVGENDNWQPVGDGVTNADGRVTDLCSESIVAGHYRISFQVAEYFNKQKPDAFYPVVRIEFTIADPNQHYHVPLLLNPFGYSTYRGS